MSNPEASPAGNAEQRSFDRGGGSAIGPFEARAPRTGVAFLDAFRVQHGPPGLLGRFFLSADTRLRERGMTLRFITFEDLVVLKTANFASAGYVSPMFDPRFAEIPPASMCLAGFDAQGIGKACVCGKPFDARQRTLTEIIDGGGFYAIQPGRGAHAPKTTLVAPETDSMRGILACSGALWVHPDERGGRLASIFTHLMTACMLTLWDPSHIVSFVKREVHGTGLQDRYGFAHAGSSLHIAKQNENLELVLMHMTAGEAIEQLGRYLDVIWPQIDAAVATRHRQHSA